MVLGLGTGSTAAFVVRGVGELISRGELEHVRGVAMPVTARDMNEAERRRYSK